MGKNVGLLILGYIISLALLFGGANLYINHKDKNLRNQAYDTFNDFFRYQNKYVDTQYSNGRIRYTQGSNPEKKPEKSTIAILADSYERNLEEWNDKFSDIYKFFRIDDRDDGWQLFFAENYGNGTMIICNIYPSYVGYRRQEYSYKNAWIPNVETCVKEAYDFWVNNSKSQYLDYYARGNKNKVDNLINDVRNEYYSWYAKDKIQPISSTLFSGKIGTAGYMYNGYYKVFTELSKYTTYEIERRDYAINEDKTEIYIIGGGLLTLIFIGLLIPIITKYRRKEKKRNQPIFDKLKDKISPANFMNPYDETKVGKANILFDQLMKTNPSDIDSLKRIREQATDELGVSFISEEYIEELKTKCNPKRFMEPYDAEKIQIANSLYNKLLNNENNIETIEEIEGEINKRLS